MLSKVAVVTNWFPPKFGGIETFIHQLALSLPHDRIVVIAPTRDRSDDFDPFQSYPIERLPGRYILPTRSARARISEIAKRHGCKRLLFTELAPLGLMSKGLRADGFERIVTMTHGAELAWTKLPVTRSLLRRAMNDIDAATYLVDSFHDSFLSAIGNANKLYKLSPGVDVDVFSPDQDGAAVREHLGLASDQIILCVSRLVPRKGQDKLIEAMPMILRDCPNAALLIAGKGYHGKKLRALRDASPAKSRIWFLGEVGKSMLPAHYAAADLFAMPCRSRYGGLELEGFGIVFLEAASSGLPVVAGLSGGASEAVQDGVNGLLVDGRDSTAVAEAIVKLLNDKELRTKMGRMGRQRMVSQCSWDVVARKLSALLWPEQVNLRE